MPITITLTKVVVDDFKVDRESKMLRIRYHLEGDSGERYGDGSSATFYQTLPPTGVDPDGNPVPLGDEVFELPTQAAQELASMITRMETALEARILA